MHRSGFEPELTAWKAEVIPLDQRCAGLATREGVLILKVRRQQGRSGRQGPSVARTRSKLLSPSASSGASGSPVTGPSRRWVMAARKRIQFDGDAERHPQPAPYLRRRAFFAGGPRATRSAIASTAISIVTCSRGVPRGTFA